MGDTRLLLALAVAAGFLWERPVVLRVSRSGRLEGSLGGAVVVAIALLFAPLQAAVAVGATAIGVGCIRFRREGAIAVTNVIGRFAQCGASLAVAAIAGRQTTIGPGSTAVTAIAVTAQLAASLIVISAFFALRDGSRPMTTLRSPTRSDWATLVPINTAVAVLLIAVEPLSSLALIALGLLIGSVIVGASATNDAGRSRAALDAVTELMPKAVGPDPARTVEDSLLATARHLLACDEAEIADAPRDEPGALHAPIEVDGTTRWLSVWGTARQLTREDRLLLDTIATTGRGLIEAARRSATVAHAADHDALTGALSRRALMRELTRAVESGQVFAVAFIDLDGFKPINDQCGHATGDELLVAVHARLRAAVRPTDAVGRLGGDEFCAVLGPLATAEEAASHAERLSDVFGHPFHCGGHDIAITASIGVTTIGLEGSFDVDEILDLADRATYAAKASGKNSRRLRSSSTRRGA